MALPMEDDQWIVMIGGVNGEAAPSDEVGMLAYARSFACSLIADLMRDCVPTGPVVTHHFPTTSVGMWRSCRGFPLGGLPLGDAVCSFDPIYGQGMTSPRLCRRALAECLDGAADLDRAFNRYTDKVVLAGQRDDAVVERFNEVISLVRPPESLLSPPFARRAPTGARRVRRTRRRKRAGIGMS